jgi:hypothetical protein
MKRNDNLETELTGIVLNEVKYRRWWWLRKLQKFRMFAGTRGRELPMPNTCKQFDFLHLPLIANSSTLPFVIVRCLNGSEHISNVFWGCIESPGDLLVVQGHRMLRTHFASSGAKICYRKCRLDEERTCNG